MLVQTAVLERRRKRSMPEQSLFIRSSTAELVKRVRLPPPPPLPFFFFPTIPFPFSHDFLLKAPNVIKPNPPLPKKKKSRLTRDFAKLLFSTTCTLSASDVGCYVEQPASSTGKSLDKQAFSSTESFIADSATTTPSQIAGLPIIFDDLDSSSSTSTSASPEAEYLLGQNNLDQEGGYSLTNNNMPNTGEFRSS